MLESYWPIEAGRPADPEGLIADNPQLARPLAPCLKVMHLAQGLDKSASLRAGHLVVDAEAFETGASDGLERLDGVWPVDGLPPHVLLPEPPDDDSPILRMHTEDRLASWESMQGAIRSWVRSPAGAWASCSRPATPTWAATWR